MLEYNHKIKTMEMQTLIFRIPEEMNKELEKVAQKEDRAKAYIIRKAIGKFLHGVENEAKLKK